MVQTFILGGYTKRENKGLHSIQFNPQDVSFSDAELIAELNGPTYVTLSEDKSLLFSIHKEDGKDGTVAFTRDGDEWRQLSNILVEGAAGCHISYREASRTLYISSYHNGNLDVFHLDNSDQLNHLQRIQFEGASIHKNQDASHVHFAGFNSDKSLLFVCDLGTDVVSTFSIAEDGRLTLNSELNLTPGTGPRHLVMHPALPYAYIIGELNSTTTVVAVSDTGELEVIQTIQNIPTEQVETSAGAAIRITRDGKFLYTSTRFHNIVTVYAVDLSDGTLSLVQTVDSVGQIPRDFILDESEQFVLIPHQDSDHITIYERNTDTGDLKFVHNETRAPECVCISPA